MDLTNVRHVRFAVLAADYRRRAEAEGLQPEFSQDFLWVAEYLDRASIMALEELEPFHFELIAGGQPTRGGFARGTAAEIIDQYLDDLDKPKAPVAA
jgi:hypothetical protein